MRIFAIRFDDDMEALSWKTQVEQSKNNNCRVRRGLDVPDLSAIDDVCSIFESLSTDRTSQAAAVNGEPQPEAGGKTGSKCTFPHS